MGTSKPTYEVRRIAGAQGVENRDQLIHRRRSAQRAWHTARVRAEQAAHDLHETPAGRAEPPTARTTLESARLAERSARAAYLRVAKETGELMGKLARIADYKRVASEKLTRAAR